jgi:hypothetical protein
MQAAFGFAAVLPDAHADSESRSHEYPGGRHAAADPNAHAYSRGSHPGANPSPPA